MNNNRRNFYRILQSQPDAPLEVIKNNYRTLLQKLKLHPDLGGENWNASIINQAYNTLKHPVRRAAYDRELLRRYKITLLSKGNLYRNSVNSADNINSTLTGKSTNLRNYYRVLHIQPDSPAAIVKSSYITLYNKPDAKKELLKEAYETLSNREKRTVYDRMLLNHSHSEIMSGQLLTNKPNVRKYTAATLPVINQRRPGHGHSGNPYPAARKKSANADRGHINSGYQPVIRHYCSFCKTPFSYSPVLFSAMDCNECNSPLQPPNNKLVKLPRRLLDRISRTGEVYFFTDWPGEKQQATISDLSPTGMRFRSVKNDLEEGNNIKIDGDDFKAVGKVTYIQPQDNDSVVGIRFMTVQFDKHKGQFLSASA